MESQTEMPACVKKHHYHVDCSSFTRQLAGLVTMEEDTEVSQMCCFVVCHIYVTLALLSSPRQLVSHSVLPLVLTYS